MKWMLIVDNEKECDTKVIQEVLGHKDFTTTMDIYTDATKDLKQSEFDTLSDMIDN